MHKWIIKNSPLWVSALIIVAMLATFTRGGSIQTIAGLAVAQSATQWNNLADIAAAQTGIASGVGMVGLCLWNGTTCDAAKGDTTNGMAVNVKSTSGNSTVVGASADNSTNVTTKLPVLPCRANAAAPTWTEGNQVPCSADLAGDERVTVLGALPTGNNTIGNINIVSTLTGITNALPTGANSIGSVTLNGTAADNSANSTTKLPVLPCKASAFIQTFTEGNQVPCIVDLAGNLRIFSTQPGSTLNSQTFSGSNAALTVTLPAVANKRNMLRDIQAACTTTGAIGTNLNVKDGATQIWGINVPVPTATEYIKSWSTALTGTVNTAMTINLGACGTGSLGFLSIQADVG